jgi:hypothetical protein
LKVKPERIKHPVIERDDYTLFFEYDKGFCFIHCNCIKWTKTIKKQMLSDLLMLQKEDIFAIHEIDDKKHAKFLALFDFKFLKDFVGLDGLSRQIYVRRT